MGYAFGAFQSGGPVVEKSALGTKQLPPAQALGTRLDIRAPIPAMEHKSDALDAVICLLAAQDFLTGKAMSTNDHALARKEGWIWVSEPVE